MIEQHLAPHYEEDPLYGGRILDYTNFVISERTKVETYEDFNKTRAENIAQEFDEFLNQHGSGITVFMSEYYATHPGIKAEGESTELRSAMIDELSDLFWYSFDIATYHEFEVGSLIASTLKAQAGKEVPIPETFNDIQLRVMSNASQIKADETIGTTSLVADSIRVFSRFEQRLVRSLRNDVEGNSVPGVSGEEPLVNLDIALGEFLLALTYVAVDKFGVDIETLANYNVYKLRHRAVNGKMSGKILFDLFG